MVEWVGGEDAGGPVRVVVHGRPVLVYPPVGGVVRLVTGMPARVEDPRLLVKLVAEGAWLEHRGRAYLQTTLAIARITPTGLTGALRGFAETSEDLTRRLRPRPAAVWCSNYAE